MFQQLRVLLFMGALSLLLAAGAFAADLGATGTVASIDPATGTIRLTDGRLVRVDSSWRFMQGGRQVALADIVPGTVITMLPSETAVGVATQPTAPPVVYGATAGSMTGTVARIDPHRAHHHVHRW
jgi:hypothetical protein